MSRDPELPRDVPASGSFGRRLLRRLNLRLGRDTTLLLLAVAIGVMGGFGAVFFRWLIATLQDVAWGAGGTPLDKVVRAPWTMRLMVPAVGGLVVGLIVKFVAPEAKGHGVPEVMAAVARGQGVIRPVVAAAKSVASAVCIASGGSVGREGPIVQIGSALASGLGQWLRLPSDRLRVCVGCGAASGIAATFNAPIAGAFFASEVILGGFHASAFGPAVVASVVATVIARSVVGDEIAFRIPEYALEHPGEMVVYAVLGLAAGVVGVLFVKTLAACESGFERIHTVPAVLQPVIGGFGVGLIAIAAPQVMGVGYDTISSALVGGIAPALLLALLGAKLLATSVTLGSGGSGGVFAPSLFLGAMLGGAIGHVAQGLPFTTASSGAYAVVGMGAVVAATTHAPITAILIIFELTGDYRVIVALMLSCIVANVVARRLAKPSIYTVKLLRRGIDVEAGQEVNVLRRLKVRDVMRTDIEVVPRTAPVAELERRIVESPHYEFFTVDEAGRLTGVISIDDLRRSLPHLQEAGSVAIAQDLASDVVLSLREDDTLDTAMRQFGKRTYEELPVLPAGEVEVPIGLLNRHDVINAYNREILKSDLGGGLSSRIDTAISARTWETVGDHVVAEMPVPAGLAGRELASLQLPQRRGVQVILVDRGEAADAQRWVAPSGGTVLSVGERIVVFGLRPAVEALAALPPGATDAN
jgi:CIC family chloride channel protein